VKDAAPLNPVANAAEFGAPAVSCSFIRRCTTTRGAVVRALMADQAASALTEKLYGDLRRNFFDGFLHLLGGTR
jgi:hypothetical protein